MSTSTMDDEYEYFTSAPQWADFTEMTSENQAPTSFFDHSHEELENLDDVPNKKEILGRLRHQNKKFKPQPIQLHLAPTFEQPKPAGSSFINDLDMISMTPIKVLSPKTKNNEPVLQELNINEVLCDAIEGMKIASTISRKTPRKNLNATVCPSSVDNSKAPGQRKLRTARSVGGTASAGITPAAKAARTPRVYPASAKSIKKIDETDENSQVKITNIIHDDQSKENDSAVAVATVAQPKTPLRSSLRISNAQRFKTPISQTPRVIKSTDTPRRSHIPTIKTLVTPQIFNECEITTQHTIGIKPTTEDAAIKEIIEIDVAKESASSKQEEYNDKSTASPLKKSTMLPVRITVEEQNLEEQEDDEDDFELENDYHMDMDNPFHQDFPVHVSQHRQNPSLRQKQPSVLTNPARRRSIIDNRRRRSNRYISLAEAVSTFQRATPTRFHSRVEAGPVTRIKKTAPTSTIPISPALQCKTRTRVNKITQVENTKKPAPKPAPPAYSARTTVPISPALHSKQRIRRNRVLSQAEREELELKDMRKHQIHARPVPKKILAGPSIPESVAIKRVTIPKPFHLTQTKKPIQPAETSEPSVATKPRQFKGTTRSKKIVTTFARTDDGRMENQEICHFGIPIDAGLLNPNEMKKTTQPQPFSMDNRNKEFLRKKEQHLKELQENENKKMKIEFHARPMPAAVKKPIVPKSTEEKSKKALNHLKVAPFSFEGRDKGLANKKEELRKKIEEEAKKARIFHANPAPTFKPVTVRATSRDNLRMEKTKSHDNLAYGMPIRGLSADNLKKTPNLRPQSNPGPMGSRGLSVDNLKNTGRPRIGSAGVSKDKENTDNQEKNLPRTISAPAMPALKQKLKVLPIELHSDKRAKLRREFDEKMRQKLEQDEVRLRREQQAKLAREQHEIAEMRKKAEPKARPMPVYKPLIVAKSNKPLTDAASPAWSRRR